MDSRNQLFLTAYVFLLVIHVSRTFNNGEPPRIKDPTNRNIFGRVGSVIKIPCEAEGSDVMMSWEKDNEKINIAWLRFRTARTHLRIKDALEEDSGFYTCEATNGFGSDEITFRLYVLGNNTEIPSSPPGDIEPPPSAKRKPHFDRPDQMVASRQVPAGNSVRLKCHASGTPEPEITWYKDGRQMLAPYYESRARSNDQWVLSLSDLKVEDSGEYKCVVVNVVGTAHFTYTLTVIGRIDEYSTKPIIKDPHPVNTTVNYGDRASFQCKVNSEVAPTIQWLKRVDSERDMRRKNNTIEIDGNHYIILQTERSVQDKENGLYMNKLIIRSATTADAGKYICLGANSMGHSMKDAYLTVLDGSSSRDYEHQPDSIMEDHSLLLLIAIPALVVVVVASVAIYCLCKKQKTQEQQPKTVLHSTPQRNHSKSKSLTPDNRHNTQGFEHQYTALHPAQVGGYNHYTPSPQGGYNAHLLSNGGGVTVPPQDIGVYLKNYGGLHAHTSSDVSSGGHRSATPPNFMHTPVQHTHVHSQNYIT